jgi:Zn-finger domain-containing protein
METNYVIDTMNIREFEKGIINKNSQMIKVIEDMIDDMQIFDEEFNSNAGKKYKDKFLSYLDNSKNVINNRNTSLSSNLNKIISSYDSVNDAIDKMVN